MSCELKNKKGNINVLKGKQRIGIIWLQIGYVESV